MKNLTPETMAIQQRFFKAFDWCVQTGRLSGLQPFCKTHGLNRTKYARIRNNAEGLYKCIDVDAMAHLCRDGGISPTWLLLGEGNMT